MENYNEVRATGDMPGLEWIVNSIKALRFKCLKLSTYNSLNNQLKLKDTIIIEKSRSIDFEKTMNTTFLQTIGRKDDIIRAQEAQIITLNEMVSNLEERNITQSNTIHQIHNERCMAINELKELQNKYQRKDQPRNGGKFAHKVKEVDEKM